MFFCCLTDKKIEIKMKKTFFKILFLIALMAPFFASAHAINSSYIFLNIYEEDGIHGRFEFNINEINKVFNLNLPKDATYDEVQPHIAAIKKYLLEHSSLSSNGQQYELVYKEVEMREIDYGNYVKLYFYLENSKDIPESIDVFFNPAFEADDTHRGFLVVEQNWRDGVVNNEAIISLYFSPEETKDTLFLDDMSIWKGFLGMVKQGVWHIWIGLDHILFLIALILPSVLYRKEEATVKLTNSNFFGWYPVLKFKPAFMYILKIVTFFTIAHTITLSLAALEIVTLPSRVVESIIAFSIGLAAFHNIIPIFKGRDWIIAFIFGLFHGFGFASVLGDLGLTNTFLTYSLFGFNIGVEIGQVLIIAGIFPILFFLRKKKIYKGIFFYGCILLIIISAYWMVERIFDVNLGVEDQIRRWLYKLAVAIGLK